MALVTTGKARFLYLNAWEPRKAEGSNKAQYSVCLVIPKSDTATYDAIQAAYVDVFNETVDTTLKGVKFDKLNFPLRDGDTEREGDENFAGCWFLNATSIYPPLIGDKDKNVITDHSQLYSGCYGRAAVSFFAYNRQGNKGIGCGLRKLLKLEDGEKIGGNGINFDEF